MRIGIDVGGTKIELLALGPSGSELYRERIPTPRDSYGAIVSAIAGLVKRAEAALGEHGTVGLAIPGILSPKTGLVKNANSTLLIGQPLDQDLGAALNRPIRAANDANCFALSEATDGAAASQGIVFGIIAGTGVGGGICVGGRVLTGAHAICGEWGHNPLPWPKLEELPGAGCYCGKTGCIETWCSGPALSSRFEAKTGRKLRPTEIAAAADTGDAVAVLVMDRFLDRFARAIATIVNILDPEVIVIGGGLSNIAALYTGLPKRVERYAFNPEAQ
ncbi:MAG: ROK family protein, partial [Alphaproteobacteria bacterium]|nr:ROK family protein [Alphaproteobacteria bacterium]